MRQRVLIISNVTANLYNFRRELLELLSRDYEVVVLASENFAKERIEEIGCKFINFDLDRHGTNPIKELGLIKKYRTIIKSIMPAIVLTYTIKPNVYAGAACASLQIPYIATITGLGDAIERPGVVSIIARMMYKYGLRSATKVFFQNIQNCTFFLEHNLFHGEYEVLPGSGVNLGKHPFETYPPNVKPIILSVIGRVTKDKGISEIIEASKHFSPTDLRIQIIGACEGDYKNIFDQTEFSGVIKYYGRQEDTHQWLKNSHAILHASYHEGMSNVLLEAAACGRPILATTVPGCIETFDDGLSGFGFEPKNVEAIIKTIQRFMDLSYEEKSLMGQKGRKKIEVSFDRAIVVDKYLAEIKKLLNDQ